MQLLEYSPVTVIAGENAVHVSQLPSTWQDIARGSTSVGLSHPQSYQLLSYVEQKQHFLLAMLEK